MGLVWLGGPYLALGLLCAVGLGGAFGAVAALAGFAAVLLLGISLLGVARLALELRRTRRELSHASALLNELADRLAEVEGLAREVPGGVSPGQASSRPGRVAREPDAASRRLLTPA